MPRTNVGYVKDRGQPEEKTSTIVLKNFLSLWKKKTDKLSIMKSYLKYLDPSDRRLVRGQSYNSDILFDATGRNLIENYTFESVSDIINPSEPWFTLDTFRNKKFNRDDVSEWNIENSPYFLTYIKDNHYFPNLLLDKKRFDIYGFSGMSFLKKPDRGMRIKTENPFNYIWEWMGI